MTREFYYKGHHYHVTPVEGSTDSVIVKDGRYTRRITKELAASPMQHVDKLFKQN